MEHRVEELVEVHRQPHLVEGPGVLLVALFFLGQGRVHALGRVLSLDQVGGRADLELEGLVQLACGGLNLSKQVLLDESVVCLAQVQ